MAEAIITVLSLLLGILSFCYAVYSTRQLKRAVKTSALRLIRTQIKLLNDAKKQQPEGSPSRATMDHTQQDLETLFKSLQDIFSISDKDAPGS